MDAWSPEQLKRMQLGGNDALNVFLNNYGVDKYTDIRDKYNSQAAEVKAVMLHTQQLTHGMSWGITNQHPTAEPNTCLYAAVLQRQNQGRSRGKELCSPSAFSIQQQLQQAPSICRLAQYACSKQQQQ